MRKASALFVLSLVLAAPAFADDTDEAAKPASEARVSNIFGATGLLTTPSAYTQRDRTASAFFNANSDFVSGGAIAGFGSGKIGFEAGVSVFDIDGGDTEVLGNLKVNFLPETDSIPALAVGVIDVADSLDIDTSWYVVASKYFTRQETDQKFALKGHIGYGGGIFSDEIFGGAELFFTPQLSALVDVADGDVNVGGRWQHKAFSVQVFLLDLDRIGGGVNYTIPLR